MRDYLNECNDRGEVPQDFMGTFCTHCKNQDCHRAGWGTSKWRRRMETQSDRFFNPNLVPEDQPLFKEMNKVDFPSMIAEAMRQEIADRRGDWEIPPEIPILDGKKEIGQRETTSVVDEAVQALAKAQGRKISPSEKQVETPAPHVDIPGDASPGNPAVDLIRKKEAPKKQKAPQPSAQNTEMPSEGIMIEGEVPTTQPVRKKVVDPWEPSTDKKIPVGGTVTLGGGKADE